MSSNAQKLSFASAAQKTATLKALDQIHNLGKEFPASVVNVDPTKAIITIKFETDGSYTLPQVTIPLDGPEYIRYPIRVGDKGVVRSGSVNISNMSGLGTSASPASFNWQANLAALIFHPIGNKNWTAADDPNAIQHYGPNGTINRDTNKKSKHVVSPAGGVVGSTGATGDPSNPTYNMTHTLHPQDGWLAQILDQANGTHFASLVPQGGSGALGWLASVFGGAHKHTIDSSGHTLTTSANTTINATATNINSPTNITGNTSITGTLSALSAAFGSMSGGSGAISTSGPISGGSGSFGSGGVASTGVISGPIIQLTPGLTVAALNTNYPPASYPGCIAYVTDATAPTWRGTLTGGGTVGCLAFSDGTTWMAN